MGKTRRQNSQVSQVKWKLQSFLLIQSLKQDYMHLVFCSLPNHHKSFKTLCPCILRPSRLWSGKQVVSTLLSNIVPDCKQKLNLISKAKISVTEWCRGSISSKRRKKLFKKMKHSENSMTESEVIFCEGELMCGVLEKSQFGASQYGFVHCCYELYGGAVANLLLSALGRLFTSFLQLRGFTLGVEDILVLTEADKVRRELMSECSKCGPEAAAEALGVESAEDNDELRVKFESAHRSSDSNGLKALDYFMKKKTDHFNNAINTACVPAGLHKPFPSNCLQLMVQSGAKGSTVNCMQISCLLGQIELEGQRPALMLSGRFLPSFLPYDPSPRAGGFVDGRFLTGIRPQEYFFHCMAGREGLVDTAVKTSRSGYLQRCLIKHLEGLCVAYDLTKAPKFVCDVNYLNMDVEKVRDSDGSVVQFLYGEDGMDISKTRFLNEKQFPFLVNNYHTICDQLDPQSAMSLVDSKKAVKYQDKVNRWERNRAPRLRPYFSGFQHFSGQNIAEVQARNSAKLLRTKENYFRTKVEFDLINIWYGLPPMGREKLQKKFAPGPIPVNCRLSPDRHFGSVSTEIYQKVHSFIDKHPEIFEQRIGPDVISAEKFESLVNFKCLRALANPGESVGLLAAQSVGEPSTQMTLNTFHFAGRGEMNVTLGIPRLREILMTASHSIKTPAMDVPLLTGAEAKDHGEELKRRFTKVKLSQVLEKVEVWERVVKHKEGYRHRQYTILLSFLPQHYYKDDFEVCPERVLEYVENDFLRKLASAVNKEIKLIKKKRSESVAVEKDLDSTAVEEDGDRDKGDSVGEDKDSKLSAADEDDDSELSGEEDESAGAASAQLHSKKQQHASYDGPGESDDEAQEEESEDSFLDKEGGSSKRQKKEGGGEEDADDDTDDDLNSDDDIYSISSDDPESMDGSFSTKAKIKNGRNKYRIRNVLGQCSAVVSYSYDTQSSEWCQVVMKFDSLDMKVMLPTIIERLSAKCVIHETPRINKGYLVQDDSRKAGKSEEAWHVKTDGVNLQELWKYEDMLDLTKAYTNDIHAMADVYGIEAAYQAIIKEVSGVFKVYGIQVDHRHLSLIADYMTFEGSYKPFNRVAMETNSSPFQKMSFETTLHFLQSATLSGECDHILSPSACLVAGRVVKGGTGSFELMQKLC